MRVGWLRIISSIFAAMMICVLFITIQHTFIPFEYASFPVNETLASTEGEVGQEVSQALWSNRQLDLIILAFLLFVTASCCTVILKVRRGEPS
ncbi:hypothetical protein KAX03_03165 [Candidatus Bathyarchaeota archaeon]|nr:hypothetical protein [Candidatus Bathyarchaeota archaeon]